MEENFEEEKPVCIVEVNENIRRVETGLPLTRSLKMLNKNCKFRQKYEEMDKIIHPDDYMWRNEEGKFISKEYRNNPEVKKKLNEYAKQYRLRPGVKEKGREYSKKYRENPKNKEKLKAYGRSPERKAYGKLYRENKRKKESENKQTNKTQ